MLLASNTAHIALTFGQCLRMNPSASKWSSSADQYDRIGSLNPRDGIWLSYIMTELG